MMMIFAAALLICLVPTADCAVIIAAPPPLPTFWFTCCMSCKKVCIALFAWYHQGFPSELMSPTFMLCCMNHILSHINFNCAAIFATSTRPKFHSSDLISIGMMCLACRCLWASIGMMCLAGRCRWPVWQLRMVQKPVNVGHAVCEILRAVFTMIGVFIWVQHQPKIAPTLPKTLFGHWQHILWRIAHTKECVLDMQIVWCCCKAVLHGYKCQLLYNTSNRTDRSAAISSFCLLEQCSRSKPIYVWQEKYKTTNCMGACIKCKNLEWTPKKQVCKEVAVRRKYSCGIHTFMHDSHPHPPPSHHSTCKLNHCPQLSESPGKGF